MGIRRQEIVTFKADASLLEAMKAVPNRSAFIRSAVLAALDGICPLCNGRGTLTPNQKNHWESFSVQHTLKECHECHEMYLVCTKTPSRRVPNCQPS